jgi:shikimate kinase
MATHKSLVLVGMMGTGKSTIGKEVAKKLKIDFIDTDQLIEKEANLTIAEIFKKNSEKYFRELEEKIFLKIKNDKEKIISVGGGAFINNAIRNKILKEYLSIWLNMDEDLIIDRIKRNAKKRPMLDQNNIEKSIVNLKKTRDPIYKLADYEINCSLSSKGKIIEKIINIYEKNNN